LQAALKKYNCSKNKVPIILKQQKLKDSKAYLIFLSGLEGKKQYLLHFQDGKC
jgi:hypothetical protein